MRRLLVLGCVAGLTLGAAARGQDDEAEARAVIARAIQAHGGAQRLLKYRAATMKVRGRMHNVLGEDRDFTGLTAGVVPDKLRIEMTMNVRGVELKSVHVLNGEQGWLALNGQVMPLSKGQLAEEKEHLYVAAVSHLFVLREKGYSLLALGEGKVQGRDAVGVLVRHKDHRDVGLYFDKESGLLVRTVAHARDTGSGSREFVAETLYDDYRKVDGVQVAHKVLMNRDGRPFVVSEATEVQVGERLDDALFERPGGER